MRRGFLEARVPNEVLKRCLMAAHAAPSVGFMQPWRFISVEAPEARAALVKGFEAANAKAQAIYSDERAESYAQLKLAGLRDAPHVIGVTCEVDAARGHGLGRQSWAETAQYSTVCAIQNFWLAARAEGVGVGWVSIIEKSVLRSALALPDGVEPIALLCVGFVDSFGEKPELEIAEWEKRAALESILVKDSYDGPAAF